MKLYAIKDTKVSAFSAPFSCRTHGEAMRLFIDHANRSDSLINAHPEDFQLFYLADIHDETGEVLDNSVYFLANATEFVSEKPAS